MTWQPIDTAPKDGTRIRVLNPITGPCETAAVVYPDGHARFPLFNWGGPGVICHPEPTHWQPLPPPEAS